jgi:hypothetical protein
LDGLEIAIKNNDIAHSPQVGRRQKTTRLPPFRRPDTSLKDDKLMLLVRNIDLRRILGHRILLTAAVTWDNFCSRFAASCK